MKKIVRIILYLICIIIFIISAYKVSCYLIEKSVSQKVNDNLIKKVVSENGSIGIRNGEIQENSEMQNQDIENKLPLSIDFSILKNENKDIVGWLYSKDTPINYPVVQSYDNNYYLRRMIDGNYNIEGTLFMDYRNNNNMSDINTIIYGHNMDSGTKFGTLEKYKKQNYYEQHKYLYYFTKDTNYRVDLFAGYTIDYTDYIYNLPKLTYEQINKLKEKSDFKSNVVVSSKDKILTLSTCSNDYSGARYVVMGILNEIK